MDVLMPFVRAYPPVLAEHGLSKADFLKLLDTTNICLSKCAPFQVAGLAGNVIGLVPHEWALGVSAGLGLIAGAGTAATCYFRTKHHIQKMNREIWEPRGLKITMVKDRELMEKMGLNEERVWDDT